MLIDRTRDIEGKIDKLTELLGHYTDLARRVEKAEIAIIADANRLACLEKWQAASVACLSLVCFIVMPTLVLLGPVIRQRLGLP